MALDGRTDGHGQTYIPRPSAGDIKVCETRILNLEVQDRALTPLFGNGARALRIGKNSVILTKIGKNQNVLCMKLLISNCYIITYMVLLYFQRIQSISRQYRL